MSQHSTCNKFKNLTMCLSLCKQKGYTQLITDTGIWDLDNLLDETQGDIPDFFEIEAVQQSDDIYLYHTNKNIHDPFLGIVRK